MQEEKNCYILCESCDGLFDLSSKKIIYEKYSERKVRNSLPKPTWNGGLCARCWEDPSNPHFQESEED